MCGSFSLNISSHCFNFSFNSLEKSFVSSFCVCDRVGEILLVNHCWDERRFNGARRRHHTTTALRQPNDGMGDERSKLQSRLDHHRTGSGDGNEVSSSDTEMARV